MLFIITKGDASSFDQEWQQKTRQTNTRLLPSVQPSHHSRGLPSLDPGRHTSTKHHSSVHTSAPKHHPYSMPHHTRPHKRHGHLEPLDASQAGPSQTTKRPHTHFVAQEPVAQRRQRDHLETIEVSDDHNEKKRVRF